MNMQKKKSGQASSSQAVEHPPLTQLNRINPMPDALKFRKEKRTDSSHFNVSKNRELQKLPLLKGDWLEVVGMCASVFILLFLCIIML